MPDSPSRPLGEQQLTIGTTPVNLQAELTGRPQNVGGYTIQPDYGNPDDGRMVYIGTSDIGSTNPGVALVRGQVASWEDGDLAAQWIYATSADTVVNISWRS